MNRLDVHIETETEMVLC